MKHFLPCLLVAGSLLAAATVSTEARANGRFPESNHLFFSETDPNLVLLRSTFGLLVSHDRGKSFAWVCEQSIGFSGVEDPMFAITPSNTIVGTTFEGITVSHDQACTWAPTGGEISAQVFIDLSQNVNDGKDIVAFSSSYAMQDDAGRVLFSSKVWETKDEGSHFAAIGNPLDPGLLGYTIDLAKSDPQRIYATAVRQPGSVPVGALLTSKDHGVTWEETPIPLLGTERSLYIAAVDPNDAERVYVRTSNTQATDPDRLLLREAVDGSPGTLRTIYTSSGALRGFALSPDGQKVYIGGPKDGLKVASTTDFAWAVRSSVQVQCLSITADGLWACSNEQTGFIAGLSTDDGVTFKPLIHFCDITGALVCPQNTPTATQCTPLWPAQNALLGCTGGDASAPGDGPAPDAGSTNNAQPLGSSGSKCSSEATPAAGPWGAGIAVVGAAIALARRKRRKR